MLRKKARGLEFDCFDSFEAVRVDLGGLDSKAGGKHESERQEC